MGEDFTKPEERERSFSSSLDTNSLPFKLCCPSARKYHKLWSNSLVESQKNPSLKLTPQSLFQKHQLTAAPKRSSSRLTNSGLSTDPLLNFLSKLTMPAHWFSINLMK